MHSLRIRSRARGVLRRGPGALLVEELHDPRALFALSGEWRDLHEAAADATPFQSWEWVSTFWRHLGRGTPNLLAIREGDDLVGLAPLVVTGFRGLPVRRLTFLGAPLSDYQGLLARPGREALVARAVAEYVVDRDGAPVDLVDLPDVRAADPLVTAFSEAAGDRGLVAPHRVCPAVALPASFDLLRRQLGRSLRQKLGNLRRQSARRLGARFDEARGEAVAPTLEALFTLHDRRWRRRGLRGAFARPEVRDFHREVAPLLDERGWLRLHRVIVDGDVRGAIYCLSHQGRVAYYLGGFDLRYARYSLGTLLVGEAIERAIGEGARTFDFLRGDERYKYLWRADDAETFRLLLTTPALRGALARRAISVERELERLGGRLRNRLFGARGDEARGGRDRRGDDTT
jgi:CelD/BcsL family acetyltransferase involved in cellulose biosynthesis